MRKVSYTYELLDKMNKHKKWLTTVISCNVKIDYNANVVTTATLTMKEDNDINYLSDRIKVCMQLNGKEYAIGIFLLCTPTRNISATTVQRQITMYDLNQKLIDDKLTTRLYVEQGETIMSKISTILADEVRLIEPTSEQMPTQKIYEPGTSKLIVVNDLLSILNYYNLHVDVDGVFKASKYVEPRIRDTVVTYKEHGIICPTFTDTSDLFGVPNVVIRYCSNSDTDDTNDWYATCSNIDPTSPLSTVSRGRRIVNIAKADATSKAELDAIAKRDYIELTSEVYTLAFQTAVDPLLFNKYFPKIKVEVGEINDYYIVTSINFNCEVGALATINAKKVVSI